MASGGHTECQSDERATQTQNKQQQILGDKRASWSAGMIREVPRQLETRKKKKSRLAVSSRVADEQVLGDHAVGKRAPATVGAVELELGDATRDDESTKKQRGGARPGSDREDVLDHRHGDHEMASRKTTNTAPSRRCRSRRQAGAAKGKSDRLQRKIWTMSGCLWRSSSEPQERTCRGPRGSRGCPWSPCRSSPGPPHWWTRRAARCPASRPAPGAFT